MRMETDLEMADAATTPTTTSNDASIASPAAPPASNTSVAAPAEANTSTIVAVSTMELGDGSSNPGEGPVDNIEDGHSAGRVEDRTQGAGYAKRGGHQNTKQGRKERKKGKKEMGRTTYSRNLETREPGRSSEPSNKRIKLDGEEGDEATGTPGEVEGEEKEARLPKRKVAVLIGYSGHGYKGMQLNYPNKTIEGDLFEAFVRAGAISRANSNDPKKSSLVRCARTDKGVHAAGNVISLKLIIEEPDIVQKINSHLPDQIRVWGILRTLSSFNCYQMCDSRVYEYLIPSYVFIPPHPGSYLGKMLRKHAIEENDFEGWESRQAEVSKFWDDVQVEVDKLLEAEGYTRADFDAASEALFQDELSEVEGKMTDNSNDDSPLSKDIPTTTTIEPSDSSATTTTSATKKIPADLLKRIKSLHLTHKRLFRIPSERLARVRGILSSYCGTHNFHNYTIQKPFRDPSAKRHIKTFVTHDPILINGVEYLSLRVHGQSFMMHQIRKMVGLALLLVRCGSNPTLIADTYTNVAIAIPKAPGVGLLLDHPVFESYNNKCLQFPDRDPLDFGKYDKEIDDFREKFIYGRMFEEEEKAGLFHAFVSFIDSYNSESFLYLGSKGVKAVEGLGKGGNRMKEVKVTGEEDEEEVNVGAGEG